MRRIYHDVAKHCLLLNPGNKNHLLKSHIEAIDRLLNLFYLATQNVGLSLLLETRLLELYAI